MVSQHGRPDDGTDATGFFNAEFFVPLKPAERWPAGVDKERLTDDMTARLEQEFPGVEFNFSQYIQDNVEEAASGVKGENSVKIYGNDLETLEQTAVQIAEVLGEVPGITDLAVLRSLGQPTVRIDVDRARAARYGLTPGDVNAVVQAAIGGQSRGRPVRGGQRPPLPDDGAPRGAVPAEPRGDPAHSDRGARHDRRRRSRARSPLGDVADVRLVSGASFIYREQQQRYVPIKFSVRGRDLGSAVLEAQRRVDEQVPLPGGYRLEWVGEFGNLQEALGRLAVAVPLAIVLICLLLYLNFGSLRRGAARRERDPDGAGRRHLRAVRHRHAVQRLGGDRLRGAVRHRGDGRHHRAVVLQPEPRRRARAQRARCCTPAARSCAR